MLRPRRLTALATVALALACAAPTSESESGPSTKDPGAANASTVGPALTTNFETLVTRSQALASPVSVVALSAKEASHCERMCGRVGECLEDHTPIETSHLEISCLDLCVNVREDAPEATRFHSCEQAESCDTLLECASEHWEATLQARVEFDSLVDASAVNVCEAYCIGIYGCMYFDKTLAQGLEFSEDTQNEVDACVLVCDPTDSTMIESARCVGQMSCFEYWSCLEQAQNLHF